MMAHKINESPSRLIRTRPAWRVLRACHDLADGEWIWKGSYEHIVQIAKVPRTEVAAHLKALAAEKALTIHLRPVLGRATISWPPVSRLQLERLLARIGPGEQRLLKPLPVRLRCEEPWCELASGHAYMHRSATHPMLRENEVMRWESPAQPVSVPIEAPPVPGSDDLSSGDRLFGGCCALTSSLGAAAAPSTPPITTLAPSASGDGGHV